MTPGWMKWAIALLVGFAIIATGFRFPWGGTFILKPFFVLNCLVLIIVVLLQSGKAADLAGAFGGAGSQTAFGPRGAANVLSKATTWCAIMFMLCALAMVLRTDKAVEEGGSVLQKVSQPAPKPGPAPATTPAVPVGQQPASQTPAGSQPPPATSQPPASSQPSPTGSQPAQQAPASSQPGQSAPTQKPAATTQQPATSQPAPTPTPTKKP